MIADFVTGGQDFARDFRMPIDIEAYLEKSRGDVMPIEEIEKLWCGWRGAVIEGECDGFAAGLAAPEGVVKDGGGTSAYRPRGSCESRGQTRRCRDSSTQTISSLAGSQRTVRC